MRLEHVRDGDARLTRVKKRLDLYDQLARSAVKAFEVGDYDAFEASREQAMKASFQFWKEFNDLAFEAFGLDGERKER